MAIKREIDGSKYDIRVLCTGPGDSEDSGYVEGVPIDPPDDKPGWVLVDLWVEHDTEQEKGEKGKVVTRLVNPAFYQLWAKPKSPKKRRKAKKAPEVSTAPTPPAEPRKKRGKRRSHDPAELRFAKDVPASYKLMVCPHVAEMLHSTINVAEEREVSKDDALAYEPRCAECAKRDAANAAQAE